MESIFELDKSSKKALIILGLIFGSIVFLVIFYLSYNSNNLTKQQILEINRHEKVIDIYRDKNEHNFLFVKYSNGSVELLDYPYKIGDSISKNRGDSIEYIFRNDSVLKNNLIQQIRKYNLNN
ncbi:hypothetical protein CQ046_03100 [Chryseobacterium sp. MYb7]|uniref:hypothetical protein n=1 Tax=Chryseobacterium sp. MYb7 TaxID=1827290 RepID=UPI000CFFF810|nr:hypothetical protein [Chryseobacterium sp. MYb7]PRB06169.1 hypothetical protein CQ046_03100 [Chryseobacterium sp. MYb7]